MFFLSGKLKKKIFDAMDYYYHLFIFPLVFLAISVWFFVFSLHFFPDSFTYFLWIFFIGALLMAYFYNPIFGKKNESK